ncbi:pilus assembly FimT family protein [Nitrospira lenta]|uniref:Putative Type IV pilin PilA n=1 Tax=Nitrospira lenta TaxID=1436998 RepID=A0A330L4Y0_9BACT|nr:prepilin-type N-terminal cleavage/methylation domain-containing protein [Nitrospira lenta]SPP64888.1 putative Type IV pilin PilA [Nitrospira lenta]
MIHSRPNRLSKIRLQEGGFTLLEIMIVVVIVGIAAALAVPNLTFMYAKYELYQTTTTLYNRLLMARTAAISRNAMIVAMPVNIPLGQDRVTFTAPLGAETFPLNVKLVLPLPVNPIGYTPRGLSTSPLAVQTIQLQSVRNPSLIYTISLAPSGKVTWCRQAINPCVLNATS